VDIREEKVDVTPAIASEWLQLNTGNRSIRRDVVLAYAHDMESNDWLYTGDSIMFVREPDGSERLADGQHRLLAIIKSKTTQRMKVEWGHSPEVQKVIDSGVARQLADNLRMEGHPNAQQLTAIARRILAFRATGVPHNRSGRLSKAQQRDIIMPGGVPDELIAEAAAYCAKFHRTLIPQSAIGFLYWLLVPIDADAAVDFLNRCHDGSNLPAGHPVLTLRNRLINERESAGNHSRANDSAIIAYAIIAWNGIRKDKNLAKIVLPKGGLTPSTYPKPV